MNTFFASLREILNSEVSRRATHDKVCHIMLTGGRAANKFYKIWSHDLVGLAKHGKFEFYFSDERCVSRNNKESNFAMVMRYMKSLHNSDQIIHGIFGETTDLECEAIRYSNLLPEKLDILLLSVGEDGHIASLFPDHTSLRDNDSKVVTVLNAPKAPFQRFSIAPSVIKNAKEVVVMACGKDKGRMLATALANPKEFVKIPVCLTIGRTWILDNCAKKEFLAHKPGDLHNTKVIYA